MTKKRGNKQLIDRKIENAIKKILKKISKNLEKLNNGFIFALIKKQMQGYNGTCSPKKNFYIKLDNNYNQR